jgi:predicted ATP-dependent serine protease
MHSSHTSPLYTLLLSHRVARHNTKIRAEQEKVKAEKKRKRMARQQAADKPQLSEAKTKAKSEKTHRTTLLDCDDDEEEEEEEEEEEAEAEEEVGGGGGGKGGASMLSGGLGNGSLLLQQATEYR